MQRIQQIICSRLVSILRKGRQAIAYTPLQTNEAENSKDMLCSSQHSSDYHFGQQKAEASESEITPCQYDRVKREGAKTTTTLGFLFKCLLITITVILAIAWARTPRVVFKKRDFKSKLQALDEMKVKRITGPEPQYSILSRYPVESTELEQINQNLKAQIKKIEAPGKQVKAPLPPLSVQTTTAWQLWQKQMLGLRSASNFAQVQNYKPYRELPFCLLVSLQGSHDESIKQQLIRSVLAQKYDNYMTVFIGADGDRSRVSALAGGDPRRIYFSIAQQMATSFKNYSNIVKTFCTIESILVLVNSILQPQALANLSQAHQTFNIYLTYVKSVEFIQIQSLSPRLLDKLTEFDPEGTHTWEHEATLEETQDYLCVSLLELSARRSLAVEYRSLFQQLQASVAKSYPQGRKSIVLYDFLTLYRDSDKMLRRVPYSYVLSLADTISLNKTQYQNDLTQLNKGLLPNYKPLNATELSKQAVTRANQYQQALFLPDEHVLHQRQYDTVYMAFGHRKYEDKQTFGSAVPFCVVYIGQSVTERSKHVNSLRSVLRQNYTNFRLVYINNAISEQVFKEIKTLTDSPQRSKSVHLQFVANSKPQPKVFNIFKAAHSFCQAGDFVVPMTSQQELIGKQFLNILNWVHTNNPALWVIYTNFKTPRLHVGQARRVNFDREYLGYAGRVGSAEFMPRVPAARAQLLRSIPVSHLQHRGEWLSSMEHLALQHSLAQLAGPAHMQYVPYVGYQDEDEREALSLSLEPSDQQEARERILSMRPLEPVYSLGQHDPGAKKMRSMFENDEGKLPQIPIPGQSK